jgi:hypothetical protein
MNTRVTIWYRWGLWLLGVVVILVLAAFITVAVVEARQTAAKKKEVREWQLVANRAIDTNHDTLDTLTYCTDQLEQLVKPSH